MTAIGALNTVLIHDGRTTGHNTDVTGFRRSFTDGLPDADLGSVVLLGAGGAGTAVAHALADLDVRRLLVVDPDAGRARTLARTLRARPMEVELVAAAGDDVAAALRPQRRAGQRHSGGHGRTRRLADPRGGATSRPLGRRHRLPPDQHRRLLDLAREAGCTVLNGAGMAVHQAADAFELITGLPADRAAMLRDFDELVATEAALDPTRDTTGERKR